MDEGLPLFIGLALGLGAVAWWLFRLIGWLRRTSVRYFYFELFVTLFLMGFELLFTLAPPEARVPQPVIGVAVLLTGASSALVLLARRFNWKWLLVPLIGHQPLLRCSFCSKSQRDVEKLIAGPNVFICDKCVGICQTILSDVSGLQPENPEPSPAQP